MRRIPQDKVTIIDRRLLAEFGELAPVKLNSPKKPQADQPNSPRERLYNEHSNPQGE
jgi:hypothetical protein